MEQATYLYYRIAEWFAQNEPGTPVPDWCHLSWPIRQETVKKLIEAYEVDTGEKVDGTPIAKKGNVHDWLMNFECSKCGRSYCDCESKY